MEEESKYYTPTIEEFRVGFEFEYQDIEYAKWIKSVYKIGWRENESPMEDYLEWGNIRVKLLDREDIESVSHKNTEEFTTVFKERSIEGNLITLQTYWVEENEFLDEEYIYLNTKYNIIKIIHKSKTLFWGKIKNKSELQQILKMVL